MKKLICILTATVFFLTSGVSTAFADSGKANKGQAKSNYSYSEILKQLKSKVKSTKNSKKQLDALLKNISEIRKKCGDTSISVFVNGTEIESYEKPVLKSGKLLLPLKPIVNALKAKYTYNPNTKTIVITKGDIKVTLTIGSSSVVVNNTKLNLEYKVEIDRKGGILIPIGLLSKILNQQVDYDKDSGTVIVDENIVTVNDNTTGDGNEQFLYSGVWEYGSQTGAYGNDYHWTTTANSITLFKFYGTKIKLFGAKLPTGGKATISIDGGTEIPVDYYSATRIDNTLIYETTAPLAVDVQHYILVRAAGTKNDASAGCAATVDRVEITKAAAANLALNKTTTASSIYAATTDNAYAAANATDGKNTTRWSSQFTDSEWLFVDLGQTKAIGRVKLSWETAFGKSYKIQVSADGTNWTDASVVTNGDGGLDDLPFNPVNARYVRMLGIQRGTAYGYSLYEFEVYEK